MLTKLINNKNKRFPVKLVRITSSLNLDVHFTGGWYRVYIKRGFSTRLISSCYTGRISFPTHYIPVHGKVKALFYA